MDRRELTGGRCPCRFPPMPSSSDPWFAHIRGGRYAEWLGRRRRARCLGGASFLSASPHRACSFPLTLELLLPSALATASVPPRSSPPRLTATDLILPRSSPPISPFLCSSLGEATWTRHGSSMQRRLDRRHFARPPPALSYCRGLSGLISPAG